MKYYIIAGEASGDLHGSNLINALKVCDSGAVIRGWGGDLMQVAGANLARHYKEMAFMGFAQVLANINTIYRNIRFCKKDITAFNPDVIIFIDYSGFNLRIAKWARENNYRTNYYISPQLWASRSGRIKRIKRDIDEMYVILPFEKEFYEKQHAFPVHFVGHPLIDAIHQMPAIDELQFRKRNSLDAERPIIALLPGSRRQEIQKVLKVMLSVTDKFPDYQFVIAGAPSLESAFYTPYLTHPSVHFVSGQTYELLSFSYAALVTSGTATLETALFKVPQVVCYKGDWVSYQIAKRIITLEYISLVNLILERELVTELIQGDLNAKKLGEELEKILKGPKRKSQFEGYYELEQSLGGKGASEKAANLIFNNISRALASDNSRVN